jgi:hypothetical protein
MKRKIIKEDGKYVFIMESDKFIRKEYVNKEVFKEGYEDIRKEHNRYLNELAAINKKIKELDVKQDEELEKFINLANRAAKYNEFQKMVEQRDSFLKNMELSSQQIKDMERVMPELSRRK